MRSSVSKRSQPVFDEVWLGYTYHPEANIFDSPAFAPLPCSQEEKPSYSAFYPFETPARNILPAKLTSRTLTTTAKKRRPVSDLEAFAEVIEYGLQSARRQVSASPAFLQNGEQWQRLDGRQRHLVNDIDAISQRYAGLFALATS